MRVRHWCDGDTAVTSGLVRSSLCSSSCCSLLFQIVFIVSSCAIVYLMKYQPQISNSYDRKADSFSIWYLIGPCLVLALLINDVFWKTPVPGKHVHVLTYFDYFTEVRTEGNEGREQGKRTAKLLRSIAATPGDLRAIVQSSARVQVALRLRAADAMSAFVCCRCCSCRSF